jgi:hypothetical protein
LNRLAGLNAKFWRIGQSSTQRLFECLPNSAAGVPDFRVASTSPERHLRGRQDGPTIGRQDDRPCSALARSYEPEPRGARTAAHRANRHTRTAAHRANRHTDTQRAAGLRSGISRSNSEPERSRGPAMAA